MTLQQPQTPSETRVGLDSHFILDEQLREQALPIGTSGDILMVADSGKVYRTRGNEIFLVTTLEDSEKLTTSQNGVAICRNGKVRIINEKGFERSFSFTPVADANRLSLEDKYSRSAAYRSVLERIKSLSGVLQDNPSELPSAIDPLSTECQILQREVARINNLLTPEAHCVAASSDGTVIAVVVGDHLKVFTSQGNLVSETKVDSMPLSMAVTEHGVTIVTSDTNTILKIYYQPAGGERAPVLTHETNGVGIEGARSNSREDTYLSAQCSQDGTTVVVHSNAEVGFCGSSYQSLIEFVKIERQDDGSVRATVLPSPDCCNTFGLTDVTISVSRDGYVASVVGRDDDQGDLTEYRVVRDLDDGELRLTISTFDSLEVRNVLTPKGAVYARASAYDDNDEKAKITVVKEWEQ